LHPSLLSREAFQALTEKGSYSKESDHLIFSLGAVDGLVFGGFLCGGFADAGEFFLGGAFGV
jgi:hypothetical protein